MRWNFQVRRGPVVAELLAASQTASVVSLGRTSRGRRRTLGSTAQSVVRESSRPILILGDEGELRSPLTVVYTGSEGSERALRFAANLHQRRGAAIRVLVWGGERAQQLTELIRRADALLRQEGVEATVLAATGGELGAILAREAGALVLPARMPPSWLSSAARSSWFPSGHSPTTVTAPSLTMSLATAASPGPVTGNRDCPSLAVA